METELLHYGTKGMRWGVRKSAPVATSSSDHEEVRAIKKKAQHEMSNSELKKVNERLQLERSNTELQSRGALAKIKKGTAIAGTILAVGTTMTAVYNFTQSPVGKGIAKAVNGSKKDENWLF